MSPEPIRRSGRKFRVFRAWTLDGYRLRSANPAGGHWSAGVNRAACRRPAYDPMPPLQALWAGLADEGASATAHRAPDPRCRCGLYGWYDADRLAGFPGFGAELVYGAVLAWGRLEAHADGLRAEYAEPAMLAYSESQSFRHVRRIQAIGSELELPVVELRELEQAAAAVGEAVPPELRPTREPPFDLDPRWAVPLAAGGLLVATAGLLGGIKQAQRRADGAQRAGGVTGAQP